MNQICLDRCSIDLAKPDHDGSIIKNESTQAAASLKSTVENTKSSSRVPMPLAKKSDELLYLSDKEAVCIESCTRLYIRSTHSMVDHFKRKLCFDNDDD